MTLTLDRLINWCDHTLEPNAFKDYCPNGLQVQGRGNIQRIVTGVTASKALIDAAIAQQADAILVHHGYFWKGEDPVLTGMKGDRIRLLMQHGISLIAYHLPLDAHPTLGNNAALADLLGFHITGALDPHDARPIGNVGTCPPMNAEQMAAHLSQALGRPALHLAGGPAQIRKVGWCTGGAQGFLPQAVAQGCDAYISGEVSERTVHDAAELGIHYFACGHHATERGGVQRLGQAIADQFSIAVDFVDLFHPV
jgi:dinuclear metal center YbgI/SA1388 family protein